jgi:hypothetical protein
MPLRQRNVRMVGMCCAISMLRRIQEHRLAPSGHSNLLVRYQRLRRRTRAMATSARDFTVHDGMSTHEGNEDEECSVVLNQNCFE